MSSTSKIEWTEATWNPVTGCTPVSEGCDHCYARRMAKRLKAKGDPHYANGFTVTCHEDRLGEPLRRRKPTMVFVCSMGDLFHPKVPIEFITKAFIAMSMCPQHIFQILTKRPERMAEICAAHPWFTKTVMSVDGKHTHTCSYTVLPNVWLGTSCENQARAAERISHLRDCPAAVRFLSLEPLLEGFDGSLLGLLGLVCALGIHADGTEWGPVFVRSDTKTSHIDWVIVGGESGPGARPMNPDWVRDIRDQCVEAKVPFFFKQWGGVNKRRAGRLLDGRTWNEFPTRSLVNDTSRPVFELGWFDAAGGGRLCC